MADSKITALTSISTSTDPANDPLVIVDVSDTSMAATGTTKKVTLNNLLSSSPTATGALTVTGLVTAGSATITGDLTVDTSTLKVDSANHRVIVGHTSGSSAFQVTNAGAAGLEIQPTGFSSAPLILSYNRSGSAYTQLTLDGSTIVHALSGSTAMTLNSTGLGVGQSPSSKFSVLDANGISFRIGDIASAPVLQAACYVGMATSLLAGAQNGDLVLVPRTSGANSITFWTGTGTATERLRIDASGNVGIGVTPSYKLHAVVTSGAVGAFRASTAAIARLLVGNTVEDVELKVNATGDGQLTANASKYLGLGSNGLDDRVILDVSGNLLVGLTTAGTTAAKTIQIANGTAPTANVTGGQLYVESGALKFRGSSGTITTIAAA